MNKEVILLLVLLAACSPPAVDNGVSSERIDMLTAMQENIPVKCVHEEKGHQVIIHMAGPLMRIDTSDDAHAIYAENILYVWIAKQGTLVHRGKLQGFAEMKTQKELIDNAKEKGVVCTRTGADFDLFTPPDEVIFNDLSETIRQAEVLTE